MVQLYRRAGPLREGSELANRKLQLGLSRCKLVFLMAMLASREGAGKELVPQGAGAVRLPQVGIANESDQVT